MDQSIGKIAYFTGCTARYNTRGEGEAFVAIMEHLGFDVFIPDQKCCGLAKMGLGNYNGAAGSIKYNADILYDLVSEGYVPVTTCPSCHFMIAEESSSIVENFKVQALSGKIREATEFLYHILSTEDRSLKWHPLDYKMAYKNPCHAKETGDKTRNLLDMIPGLDITAWYDKCCGMGGTFGMKDKHYEKAEKIAIPMKDCLNNAEADVQSTTCGACAVQVENVTGRKALHPLVLLQESLRL